MESKQKIIETKIIEALGLDRDFFERNEATIEEGTQNTITISFRYWSLRLKKGEYEKLKDKLAWLCVACCGFGGVTERQEGEFITLEGYPCMCHPFSWGWTLSIRL
jgi:hypothetical protein